MYFFSNYTFFGSVSYFYYFTYESKTELNLRKESFSLPFANCIDLAKPVAHDSTLDSVIFTPYFWGILEDSNWPSPAVTNCRPDLDLSLSPLSDFPLFSPPSLLSPIMEQLEIDPLCRVVSIQEAIHLIFLTKLSLDIGAR